MQLINITQLGLLIMGTSVNFIMYIKYAKYKAICVLDINIILSCVHSIYDNFVQNCIMLKLQIYQRCTMYVHNEQKR